MIRPQPASWDGAANHYTHMKNNKIVLAVLPGAIAVAALVLSVRYPVNADSLVGFGAALVLLGVATVEYRINWKRVFGR